MSKFITDSELNSELEKIFKEAEEFLAIFSPFIKLHNRLKDILNRLKQSPQTKIVIVFGKNKEDKAKSFGKEEFLYFKEFPDIEIRYNERLHAKFYQNQNFSLLSSMNLYDFSINNNIEFGILLPSSYYKIAFKNKLDEEASKYFEQVYDNSEVLFSKEAKFEKKLGGLKSIYSNSEIVIDKLSEIYELSTDKKISTPKKNESVKVNYKSTTAISKELGIQSKELFEILNKNGLISRSENSWVLTNEGKLKGGILKNGQYGEYIAWPDNINFNEYK